MWTCAALVLAIGAGSIWVVRARSASGAISTRPAGPTAVVLTRLAGHTTLVRRLNAFGEVATGKTVGISFQRAGQVIRLDAVPGRRVSRGALLAVLSPDPAAVQAYEQAVTAMNLAEREWHRLQELLKLQLATSSQVDTAEKAFRDAQGAVKALNQTGGGAGDNRVTAPFDGVVVSTAVAQGDRVAAGAPILQLGHTDVLKVQIGIEPADSRLVTIGTRVTLVPVVGADDQASPIEAMVNEMQDIVDAKTLLVNAVVVLPTASAQSLVPGMKVRASLAVGRVSALALPRDAVLTDERGTYVFQIDGGKAHRVAVTKGLEADGMVSVSGLSNPALPIAVVGNYVLEDGMAVDAKPQPSGTAS